MKKRMWKMVLLCTLLLMLVSTVSVNAASKKSKALKSFATLLRSESATVTCSMGWGKHNVKFQNCSFALAYIDKDTMPELLVKAGSNVLLYVYKGGKAVYAGDFEQEELKDICYYKKKGIIRARNMENAESLTYYKLASGKKKEILDVQQNSANSNQKYYYKVNGKKSVTLKKAEFNKELKKLVGKTKMTKITKYLANTEANRKSRLK